MFHLRSAAVDPILFKNPVCSIVDGVIRSVGRERRRSDDGRAIGVAGGADLSDMLAVWSDSLISRLPTA
jgi:hypothetical protein